MWSICSASFCFHSNSRVVNRRETQMLKVGGVTSDILGVIFGFVENDYIPVFRQVCKTFKDVVDWESVRGEGLLYKYGRVKRYRNQPPFEISVASYLGSVQLFDWALKKGGYDKIFSLDIDNLMGRNHRWIPRVFTFFKYACRELIIKYFFTENVDGQSLILLMKSDNDNLDLIEILAKRWHSIEHLREYEKMGLIKNEKYRDDILSVALSAGTGGKRETEEMMKLIDNWIHGVGIISMRHVIDIVGSGNIELFSRILNDGRVTDCDDWKMCWINMAIQSDNLDMFLFLMKRYSEFYSSIFDTILECACKNQRDGVKILDFLFTRGFITIERVKLMHSFHELYDRWIYIKWLFDHGVTKDLKIHLMSLSRRDSFLQALSNEEIEAIILASVRPGTDTSNEWITRELLPFAIECDSISLFDFAFPTAVQPEQTRVRENYHGLNWKNFSCISRFIDLFDQVLKYDRRQDEMMFIQIKLAEDGRFDFLQKLYERGENMYWTGIRIVSINERRLNDWLTSIGML